MALVLRLNDRGPMVQKLQEALNKVVASGLVADGHFGAKTEAALKTFQTRNNLTPDGVAGPATFKKLGLDVSAVGKDARLGKADYIAAAKLIPCDPAMVHAIGLKESRKAPFLPSGDATILFERHQFYNRFIIPRKPGQTREALIEERAEIAARYPTICNKEPGGYKGGQAEYDRLNIARGFSEIAALESASYGQFQVMGFNAVAIGYSSVLEFERLMQQDVFQHLEAFVRFIKNTPLARQGIMNKDFAKLALGYNGKDYKINNYDVDLRKYYNQVKGEYA